jgi:DNA-binding NarL/FixJ family response regulator
VLIGRDPECRRLERLLADARRGRSGTLVVGGEAGVGKTALVDFAIQAATGFDVLHVVGLEREAELGYAGLHALLRPLVARIEELPKVQADALRVALGLAAGDADPFLAAAGTLTLLAQAAETRPLLLAVDDAHWLDRASADAIMFVGRRLEAEALAIILVTRPGSSTLERIGFEELRVQPLPEDRAVELLQERWGSALDEKVARRLAGATAGNPLALIEVSHQLSEDERLARAPLAEPLPVSSVVERGVRTRLMKLPARTRAAALLAAIDDTATRTIEPEDLMPAEQAGLLHLHRGRAVFAHPLHRAAIYQSASAEQRRAAHKTMAGVLIADDERDLRAWHLAAAADGRDEQAARALEAAADRAEARGGTAARARALERAAELSADDAARNRRLYAAARAATVAGNTEHARALVERALTTADDPLIRADLLHALAAIVDWQAAPVPAEQLERAAAMVSHLDPERAAKLLIMVVGHYSDNRISVPDLLRVAAALEALVPHLGPWWRPRALGGIAFALRLDGQAHAVHELVDELLRDPIAAATQALLLIRLERYDDARDVLRASLELGRSAGQPLRVAWTQMCFARLEATMGHIPQATAAASEAVAVAGAIEANSVAAPSLLTLAEMAADAGRQDECRRYVHEGDALGESLDDESLRVTSRIALARLASTCGQYDQICSDLDPIAARLRDAGVRDPTYVPYHTELIEAHVRRGNDAEAHALLDEFKAQAAALECRWALATAERYEAMLASESEFDERFRSALELHAAAQIPLAEARTRLCYGERLRRARRRRDARDQLRAAITTFDELGAAAWSRRAAAEFEATGQRLPKRDPTAPERLTPQELQIALQVAEGRSNGDIAAALFLSRKTIEYHLTHVYRKLNIHSRAELIRLFSAQPIGATEWIGPDQPAQPARG